MRMQTPFLMSWDLIIEVCFLLFYVSVRDVRPSVFATVIGHVFMALSCISPYGGAGILAKEPRSQRANIVFFCELLVFLSQKPTVLRCREVKNANYALQLFAEICLDSGIDGGESGRSRCPLLSVFSCAVCVCIRFLSTFRVVAVRQIFLRI